MHLSDRTIGRIRRPRWKRVAATLAVWAAIALFFSTQNVVRDLARESRIRWAPSVGLEILYWVPWLLLVPVLLFAVRRYRLEPPHLRRNLLPHLGFAVGVSVAQVAAYYGLRAFALVLADAQRPEYEALATSLQIGFAVLALTAFWKYWVFVGVYYAFDYYRRYQQREVAASRLEAQLSEARLRALQMQINPHFLFNSLHSVAMLNLTDPSAANEVLIKLSDLLRISLNEQHRREVRLQAEVDFLDRYLEIERLRFPDRLVPIVRLDDRLLGAMVPNLILQPLVENAIRHAIAVRSSAGRLEIEASASGDQLVLEVRDDGPGLPRDWVFERDAGTGLRNTRERLEAMHGQEAALELVSNSWGGLTARIRLPFRYDGAGRQVDLVAVDVKDGSGDESRQESEGPS